MKLEVNGLSIQAAYPSSFIENELIPALHEWTTLHKETGQRLFLFLMGPPGSGKSTLSLYLEQLSRTMPDVCSIQALSMDGFHYTNEKLKEGGLSSRKGAPFTFDLEALRQKILEGRSADNWWPVYSRQIHDPIPNSIQLTSPIILLEGNYLFLDAPGWKELSTLADEKIWLEVDETILKSRLISRKMQGGQSEKEAALHYETSDRLNVELVKSTHLPQDRTWKLYNQDKEG